MIKTVAICTLGCKVNAYESEAVIEQFVKKGYQVVGFEQCADIYVINTCTVTHLSDRKSRQMIRRTKQKNKKAVLVVMGCYAQTAPEEIMAIPEVDLVLGSKEKCSAANLAEAFLQNREKQCRVADIAAEKEFEELSVVNYENRSRANLKVQDGCNNFCAYCIIPYARGRIRSRRLESCVAEAKRLVENGYSEIVLVGIHLASYGLEGDGPKLLELLMALNEVEGIRRIRLGSLEPTLFDEDFTKKMASLSKICRHFHLSLQSGCDATLKRMNRHYTTEEYANAVARIRKYLPGAAITTDIMTGFPGETEEEFAASLAFTKQIGFADAHIFQYSIRKGTKAAAMPNQVDPQVKEKRSRQLIAATAFTKRQFVQSIVGQTVEVLFEQVHKENVAYFEGKTDSYITVLAKTDCDISGVFGTVRITEEQNGFAVGEIVTLEA